MQKQLHTTKLQSKYILKLEHHIYKLICTIKINRSGIEDIIVSLIPQIVMIGLGFLSSTLIARGLGPTEVGRYALVISISGLAAGLSDLGINRTALRYASLAKSNGDIEGQHAILRWAFRIRMALVLSVSTSICLITPLITGELWHSADLTILIWMSLLTGIFGAIAAVPTIYYQSVKRFKMNALVSIGQSIIAFSGILILTIIHLWKIEYVIIINIVAISIGAAIFLGSTPKEIIISNKNDEPLLKKIKNYFHQPVTASIKSLDNTSPNSFALLMVVTSILTVVTLKIDVWLMGIFLDKTQIGIYSIATYFILPLTVITTALNTVLWPHVSSLKSKKDTLSIIKKAFMVSSLGVCLGAIYSIVTPQFIPYLFGNAYSGGILIAQMLCIAYCVPIITSPVQIIGMNLGFIRHYWWISIVQLTIIILVNMLLLKQIGPLASAIALLFAHLAALILTGSVITYKAYHME